MNNTIQNEIRAKKLTANSKKQKAEFGFTIVEVLISLTIFSIAITGVITVAAQGSLNINAARNRVTAAYLAVEGIELMRAMRDTAVVEAGIGFEDIGWGNFTTALSGYCTPMVPCDIDVTDLSSVTANHYPSSANFTACGGVAGPFCPLYYDDRLTVGSGFYTNYPIPGVDPSIFSRSIIARIIRPDEVAVESTVTWKEGVTTQTITQTENIYNWYH